MKIELAIALVVFLILLIWSVWFRVSTKRLRKKYDKNPNENKSKPREEFEREKVGRRQPEYAETDSDSARPPKPSERSLLETPSVNLHGKDSKLSRETRRRRNPFRRRGRRI